MTQLDAAKGINRRTALRVGAATAWSAPLVQAVTAAPAFAAVSGPANLSGTSGTITRDTNTGLCTITVNIINSGGSATQALAATLISTPANIQSPTTAAGWSGTSPTWTAIQQIPAGGNKTFDMTFSVGNGQADKANTVTVTFATTGGTVGSVAVAFPAEKPGGGPKK